MSKTSMYVHTECRRLITVLGVRHDEIRLTSQPPAQDNLSTLAHWRGDCLLCRLVNLLVMNYIVEQSRCITVLVVRTELDLESKAEATHQGSLYPVSHTITEEHNKFIPYCFMRSNFLISRLFKLRWVKKIWPNARILFSLTIINFPQELRGQTLFFIITFLGKF